MPGCPRAASIPRASSKGTERLPKESPYFLTEGEQRAILDFDGDGTPDREDRDAPELFITLFAGRVKAQVYCTATYTHKINDTITVAGQVGYTHGDGPDFIYGDGYVDYSVTLNETVREGLVFSLALIDTNLKDQYVFAGTGDDPKLAYGYARDHGTLRQNGVHTERRLPTRGDVVQIVSRQSECPGKKIGSSYRCSET